MADLNSLSSSTTSKLDLPDEVKSGVVVGSVQKGMPADGKLQENDVITEIDGKEISSKLIFKPIFTAIVSEIISR